MHVVYINVVEVWSVFFASVWMRRMGMLQSVHLEMICGCDNSKEGTFRSATDNIHKLPVDVICAYSKEGPY